ncbi:MAG: GNAT family N-acetyltransferase [Pseudomonadota bacterium]
MAPQPMIRAARPEDALALDALYAASFAEEDLRPVVRALSTTGGVLSLVAVVDAAVAGHIAFTPCGLAGAQDAPQVCLLAPFAVAPALQWQGIGRRLLEAGLARVAAAGAVRVFVLGDPALYGRFGFAAEHAVAPPYPLPREWDGAWQSRALGEGGAVGPGRLSVPAPWRDPALWAP